jgi:hypothetical protein
MLLALHALPTTLHRMAQVRWRLYCMPHEFVLRPASVCAPLLCSARAVVWRPSHIH